MTQRRRIGLAVLLAIGNDSTLADHRSRFGLTVADERVLPKIYWEEYEQEYGGHEQDFLLALVVREGQARRRESRTDCRR